MKYHILTIAIWASIAASAFALHLTWDANPDTDQVTQYTVYKGTIPVATVSPTASPSWLISPAPSPGDVYTVTATNITGEGPRSSPIGVPAVPGAPQNLRISQ